MKTLVMNSACMMIIVMLIWSCREDKVTDANAGVTSDQSATEVQKVSAPSLDIHTAAYLGDLNGVRQHIKAGTDLDQKDQYGSTPLIIATTFGKTDVARALIEAGADLSVANNEGSTPLHIAAFFCKPEIVEILLANGADKAVRNNYGSTAWETVSGPFDQVRSIYDAIGSSLEPLGMKLDYTYLEATRPKIAEMLQDG